MSRILRLAGLTAGVVSASACAAVLVRLTLTMRQAARDVLPVLVYHRVLPAGSERVLYGDVTADAFCWQLGWLARRGYRGVSLGEAWETRQRPAATAPPMVAITLDDGSTECLDVAAPILEHFGFGATFFIPTGLIGGQAYVPGCPEVSPQPRLMDWAGVAVLRGRGFEIGSHSRTHVDLEAVACSDPSRLEEEIGGSRDDIGRELGQAPAFIAYPYGSYNEDVIAEVRRAGYVGAACSVPPDGVVTDFAIRRRSDVVGGPHGGPHGWWRRIRFASSYPGPEATRIVRALGRLSDEPQNVPLA